MIKNICSIRGVRYIASGLLLTVSLLSTSLGIQASSFVDSAVLQNTALRGESAQRDIYRHPSETLAFFGVESNMTVVEVWPGGGWYTEILAPHLATGKLYAAHFPRDSAIPYLVKSRHFFEKKMQASAAAYSNVTLSEFNPDRAMLSVPDGSADRVLTFRNVHNWLRNKSEAQAFHLFFKALKPGGVLGLVEHRAKPGTDWETMAESGYMTEAYVIALAEKAGFVLEAKSDINANSKDSANHPKGVWSLPPSFRMGKTDRAHYRAIGESDRMTLRFKKPETMDGK